MKVSWQVTGIRKDAWANAHRVQVERKKPAKERGYYLHPELHGKSAEKGIEWVRHPELMNQRKKLMEEQKHQKKSVQEQKQGMKKLPERKPSVR
jgi:hypothetical protein